ncbi:MAG: GAF domain-containing sensor histidine kinase [Gemmatimonadales bacterium]
MDSLPTAAAELAAADLQLAVTIGLLLQCALLHARYRGRYFGLWAIAWGIYATRLLAMVTFLRTGTTFWLFAHQVATGWTALALLWATLVFAQRLVWKRIYLAIAALPLVWSYLSIYVLDVSVWTTAPMVAFLSATTGWAAWAFFRYDRLVRSPAARFLSVVLVLWALHHLDYPLLRAQGAWTPWGYYLDIGFELAMGLGILFLVLEDLDQGLRTLTALSGELQVTPGSQETMAEAMLRRALSLRGVHGSALWLETPEGGRFVQGAGVAALWPFEPPPAAAGRSARDVVRTGIPSVARGARDEGSTTRSFHAYTAALPVLGDDGVMGALVVVGEARDPFTVLDNRFLLAFGQQVGAALANEELHRSLGARTAELEKLQARMVRQHEEERDRLWRALHDETAQVLAALNLQLGLVEERGDAAIAPALARAKTLVGEGIKSIRSVTRNLRPMALDDLGLVPALRALARDFEGQDALEIAFEAPERVPPLAADAEVALYRALQEALANAVRHGGSRRVQVRLQAEPTGVTLTVTDNGPGFPPDAAGRLRSRGGLAGIRERIAALGGDFAFGNANGGGARVSVRLPVDPSGADA